MPTKVNRSRREPKRFQLRPLRLYIMILLGLVLVSQGLLLAFFLLFVAEGVTLLVMIVGLIFAASFSGVGIWGTFYSGRRLWKSPRGFTVGPEGLSDPTIHPDPLPWSAIQRPLFRYSGLIGWRLMFDVDVTTEERLDVPPRRRQVAALWRAFGSRSYRLYLFGTHASVPALRDAIAPYLAVDAPVRLSRLLGRE